VIDERLRSIFRKGSKTYYNSTVFFRREVKEDVFKLYAFVRVADDLVDSMPQRAEEFQRFKERYHGALAGEEVNDIVISSFIELSRRKRFDGGWVEAFLRSMEMDLHHQAYQTMSELDTYLYGSAEVIGLMMARIMDLPDSSHYYARYLGKAMQYINFIRDIKEDNSLGRLYFPQEELAKYGLPDLSEATVFAQPGMFRRFMRAQIKRYTEWQHTAELGYAMIPRRDLVAIKTAADMYKFTAARIYSHPARVFRKKVKPSVSRIMFVYSRNRICPLANRPGQGFHWFKGDING
jgi:phytoene synthase